MDFRLKSMHDAPMKKAVIFSFLFTALISPPAIAHTAIGNMLKDAVIDHDLEKIRIDLLKDQRKVDSEDRLRVSGKDDPTYHAKEAKPATSP
jgi:hypothetical protein